MDMFERFLSFSLQIGVKPLLLGFIGLAIACAPKTSTNLSTAQPADFFHYKAGQLPKISVHRGGGDLKSYPENCLESFAYVANQVGSIAHPAVIECDIDLTKDSVMVMMHDATLDRTTTGTGKLIEKNYAELEQFRLEDNLGNVTPYKIPTLEQTLQWGKSQAGKLPVTFTLDVKRNVSFAKVVDMVHKTGTSNYVAVITYNAQDAAKVNKLDPNLMISVTIRNQAEYDRLRELGVPDNRMVAFVGVKEPDAELYKFLHEKGIACILGTLGNLDKQADAKGYQAYKTFVDNGADILSTDRPLEMARVIYK